MIHAGRVVQPLEQLLFDGKVRGRIVLSMMDDGRDSLIRICRLAMQHPLQFEHQRNEPRVLRVNPANPQGQLVVRPEAAGALQNYRVKFQFGRLHRHAAYPGFARPGYDLAQIRAMRNLSRES